MPQPVDLLMQTGYFVERGYTVNVIDAIVEKKSPEKVIKEIIVFNPDLIITQCGSVSFEEDRLFFNLLKKQLPNTQILSSGDIFLEDPAYFLKKFNWLDGIITDFFGDGSLKYFDQRYDEIEGITFKVNGEIISKTEISSSKLISLPRPRHELFKNKLYQMPFANAYPMATVLTNYACPYPCTFCIMSTLGFKSRPHDDVIEELLFLKELGIKYLYFSDQTFYVVKNTTEKILDFMTENSLGFQWVCFSRVDILDEDKMRKMKEAGCHVIMFGVEWAEDQYSDKYKKQYVISQVRNTFEIAKKVGIKRMGTFLIGLPGQNEDSIKSTVDFAINIDADYASFNIAVPRAQTSFREEAIEQGLISPQERIMDQSGSFITMGTGLVSPMRIKQLKNYAYTKFYFRPNYLAKRLLNIQNYHAFKSHVREGYYMLKSLMN